MSIVKRSLSGSFAAWMMITLTLVSQFMLIPLFIKYQTIQELGVWLALQAAFPICTIFSYGYHQYIEGEILKRNENEGVQIGKMINEYLTVGFVICLVESMLIYVVLHQVNDAGFASLLGLSEASISAAKYILGLQIAIWVIFTNTTAVLQRALLPFNEYHNTAWWIFIGQLTSLISVILSIIVGLSFESVCEVQSISMAIFNIVFFKYLRGKLKMHAIYMTKKIEILNFSSFKYSLPTAVRNILIIFQQQGIRLLIAPAFGIQKMTEFSSMRTISNASLQGMNSIVNPIVPDFIKLINEKKSSQVIAIFYFLWFLLVYMNGAMLVLLQFYAEYIFSEWTGNEIKFDSKLFACFSITLLLYGMSLPMQSLLKIRNIVRPQIVVLAVGAVVIVGCTIFLSNDYGLVSIGIGMVISEFLSFVVFSVYSMNMVDAEISTWPKKYYILTLVALISASILIFSISEEYIKGGQSISVVAIIAFMTFILIAMVYVYTVPVQVVDYMRRYYAK